MKDLFHFIDAFCKIESENQGKLYIKHKVNIGGYFSCIFMRLYLVRKKIVKLLLMKFNSRHD